MTPYFPGLPQMQDARFVDGGGNVATVLDITIISIPDGTERVLVIAKCMTEGKIFTMTIDKWNEIYTSIDSKAYKQQVQDRILK